MLNSGKDVEMKEQIKIIFKNSTKTLTVWDFFITLLNYYISTTTHFSP